jgi:hypothetical protein
VLSSSTPIPTNGYQYTKSEASEVLLTNDSRAAVKEMIKSKYAPCGKSSLYRMLQSHNQGIPILNTAWSTGGRPRVLKDTAISSIVQRLSNDVGRTYGRKEVNELIIDHRNQLFNDAGHIPLHADYKLKATTLQNYTAELAMTSELYLTQSSIAKTNTWFAAEHSFRGAISNVMLIANTHFIEMDEEDVDVRRELKEVPVETRMFYNLITDSRNGVPVVPVKPELITSTDDSTVFIFCGSNNQPDEFRLVTKKSCWNKGTNSVYNVDECDHMNGMRVKLTWTLSGGGTCAPLFVTVTGLNDRELPTA